MARKVGKRYSRYQLANTLSGTPEAGSALDRYLKWRKGETEVTYTRESTSNPNGVVTKAVRSFLNPDDIFIVTFSKRSDDKRATILGSTANTALQLLESNTAGAITNAFYRPAKASVTKSSKTTSATKPRSQITNKTYTKYNNSESITVPFGKTATAGDKYSDRISAIKTAAKASDETARIILSFKPESIAV